MPWIRGLLALLVVSSASRAQDFPFRHKVEVYRSTEGGTMAFALTLEQPFLAGEFERIADLRLRPLDPGAHLIFPKQAQFAQKHAAFYGRLQGTGKARLGISYQTVAENRDGTRLAEFHEGELEIEIPEDPTGRVAVFLDWAREQNAHFLELLRYYPHDTFLKYCLLQSERRYGVQPPDLPAPAASKERLEEQLYQVVTGSLAIQEALQQQTMRASVKQGDLDRHIRSLSPPDQDSLPYEELLEKKREDGVEPALHDVSRLIPEDQYLLQFNSMRAANEIMDLTKDWGGSLLRLFAVRSRDNHLAEKFEEQLILRRDPLTRLFADGVIDEVAMTGTDVFVTEGTDVTLLLRLKHPEVFERAAQSWLEQARSEHPDLVEREFHYRETTVAARYTEDRGISSFMIRSGDYAVYSNSHVAIRRTVDTILGSLPALHDVQDYQYVTTLLPPSASEDSGYFYASEAFLRRQIGPALKISEKRRVQCFNNLVMLNNASLFYRHELGHSPESLGDMAKQRFVDPDRLVCQHGGAYAFDAERDAATCSLHNRLKYLTPNIELEVLAISRQEEQEYRRYLKRYEAFWGPLFDPVAIRIQAGRTVQLETCVLPFANSSQYRDLRELLEGPAGPLDAMPLARTTIASLAATLGQKRIGDMLREIPGIGDTLAADPALTDLTWVGDQVSFHLCDDHAILETDPTQLRPLDLMGHIPLSYQSVAAFAILSASLPTYARIEIGDTDKAQRFLELLNERAFLEGSDVLGLETAFDAYRLPDYRGYRTYVLTLRLYALKLRLNVSLVGDWLVVATTLDAARQAIDAAEDDAETAADASHLLLRLDIRALDAFRDSLEVYWSERARLACHNNIMALYNLVTLYKTPLEDVSGLSEAKYGITYFCPEEGNYVYESERDLLYCSVHGDRQRSRQDPGLDASTSFSRFVESLDVLRAQLRFDEEALMATVEIARTPQ